MAHTYNEYIFSNISSNFNILEGNILINNNEAIKNVDITIDLLNENSISHQSCSNEGIITILFLFILLIRM